MSERVDFWIITFHQLYGVPICMLVSVVFLCVGGWRSEGVDFWMMFHQLHRVLICMLVSAV